MLEKCGYHVTVSENGSEALDAIVDGRFDLVLMDMQMPVMDGIEATLAIRAREKIHGGRLPIVAMTANVMPGDRERCLQAGMDDYISKPIQPGKLLECIAKLLGEEAPGGRHLYQVRDEAVAGNEFNYEKAIGKTDPVVLDIVGELTLNSIPQYLADIAEALKTTSPEEVHRAAHTFKGVVGYFCATPLIDITEKIEHHARQSDLAECTRYFDQLEIETAIFLPHLEKLMRERRTG